MRILGWNCRGICNASTVQALRALIRIHHPQVIFLCETKASENRQKKVASSLGFTKYIIVGAQRKAGGVFLLLAAKLSIDVLEFNSVTIGVKISDNVCSWSLIGFYGPLYHAKRIKAWTNLYAFLASIDGP